MNAYLDLVTSQHCRRPRFMGTVAAVTAPLVELQGMLEHMRACFDVDSAVGAQLDRTGEWIGRSRWLTVPITDTYFTWNVDMLGWNQGYWRGKYDPDRKEARLDDDTYRLVLKTKIGANRWNGTIPDAYDIWKIIFDGIGSVIIIQDRQDMSMIVGLTGSKLDPLMRQLVVQRYIDLKPEGVRVDYYAVSDDGGPLFAWNCDSDELGGWGKGRWPVVLYPFLP